MNTTPTPPHHITFVGAGPGAADLITLRGAQALSQAQIILHDALIDPSVLQHAHPNAQLIDVGKRGHTPHCKTNTHQHHINQQLIHYGTQYPRVIRLKGGDPTLFGRLDEEIQAITQAGLNYTIIPGITSALAAAASAKTPLTRRGTTRSIRLLTATVGTNQPHNPWDTHLNPEETLIIYMGTHQTTQIAQTLLTKHYPPHTPVILVHGASWANEHIQHHTLHSLAHTPTNPHQNTPCIILIGTSLHPQPTTTTP